MLIGEKPGIDESTSRPPTPFVGPSGRVLNTYLAAANIERSEIFLTNCVKEFTDYSKPTSRELERDKPSLIEDILNCDPEVIGLVGAYAVTHVLGWDKADLERRHGVPIRVGGLFGGEDELEREGGWVVVPVYHPANVIHAPEMSPVVLDDYLRLGMLLDGEITPAADDIPEDELDYRVVNAADLKLGGILPQQCSVVGIDTEGSYEKPWSLQFSVRPGQSFLIRGNDHAALNIFADWLETVKPFVSLQNSLHDLPVLRAMEIELAEGSYHDTMIHAYQLCCEPQGLKPLAYRHAGMLQDSYDDVIGDVGYGIAMEYLFKVAASEWPEPEPEIIKDGTGFRVKKSQGVNKLVNRIINDIASGKTNKSGDEVDPRERWKKLSGVAKAPVIAAIGDMRVPDLDDIEFDRAKRYACRDADCQLRITEPLEAKIKAMELEQASEIDHAILPMIDRMMEVGIQLAPPAFWNNIDDQCDRQMNRAIYNIYQFAGKDINPNSGDQVAEYLYGSKANGGLGLKPPMMTESGSRGSVNAVSLEGLLSQSPIIQDFMDYTEAQRIKSTYVEPLRELCQIGDGRTHPTIRTTRTTTGRLSMADPPIHQIPIMTDIGRQLRGGFIAPDGRILASFDFSHLEMRMCAHDSKDPELCRMFWENRDIHAETACKIFSVPMSQLSVDSRGKVDDPRRTVAKHCIAEGQLVLTDQGLVPIEKITLRHLLWDGVEWVSHDGVIDQGIQEVMEYGGVTATPDHEVYTEEFGFTTLRQASLALARFEKTEIDGQAVRIRRRDLLEAAAEERIHRNQGQMYPVWPGELESGFKPIQVEAWLQAMRSNQIEIPRRIGRQVRRDPTTLQYPSLSWLRRLRRSRHQVYVRFPSGFREMGRKALTAPLLSGYHDRSQEQQRALRAGEFEIGNTKGAERESQEYGEDIVGKANDTGDSIRQPLLSASNVASYPDGYDRRTDNQKGHRERSCQTPRMAGTTAVVKKSRVYDILNAGPRKCFTVSSTVLGNCAFGIINGITEHGVVNYLILNRCRRPDGQPWTLDDCEMILKEWFVIYKGVKRFQQACIEETRATGIARETIGGRIIYLPQIWSDHKTTRETAERMSYVMHTQGGGQSIVKRAMAPVWQEICKDRSLGVDTLFQMHDELVMELPDREDIKGLVEVAVKHIFCNTTKLRVPVLCAGGFGQNWLEAH